MDDELSDKELDERIASLIGAGPSTPRRGRSTRRRGRPPNGFAKALKYADQVSQLMWAGMSPWRAKTEVARLNGKRPEHISQCVKMINETPLYEWWEHDETE